MLIEANNPGYDICSVADAVWCNRCGWYAVFHSGQFSQCGVSYDPCRNC